MTIPDFPNFFCLYGPNTNGGSSGIIFTIESQVRYFLRAVNHMLRDGFRSIEVKAEVCHAYVEKVDERLAESVWALPGITNWYRNSRGRVVTQTPWRNIDYWLWTYQPNPEDFVLTQED
jgi:4-hydroxyacetophenone monooxygenase